jgi:hypothetical protein
MTNFLALNKTNHRTILMQFWGEPQNNGRSTSCGGLLKDSIGNFGNNNYQKVGTMHQWKQNLGTTWLSYHGACCPYLALKLIILIIGKFGKTMVI